MPNLLSDTAQISTLADIEESVKGSKLVVGDQTMIDAFVKIKFAGGTADIVIGDQCYINSGSVIYSGNGVRLGNKVLIAANCTLASANHGINKDATMLEQPFMESRGGINIGNDVWIGANTVVLDGTTIPDGCVIGAGSVVMGTLEPYGIYAGNPISLKGFRK